MASDLPPDAPAPRLCHLVKWPDFDGYGFNLHAEKAKTGQYIGKVDPDSPAEHAGMHEGDRIIEVNGVNIANENHRQVVERIKAVPYETKLLVVDDAADRWYKEKKLVVKSSQSNVLIIKTPLPRPTTVNDGPPIVEKINGEIEKIPDEKPLTPKESTPEEIRSEKAPSEIREDISDPGIGLNGNGTSSVHSNSPSLGGSSRSSSPKTLPKRGDSSDTSQVSIPNSPNGDLNLNMSAAEMREKLASRKKRDPKKQQMDMREKYHIVQQM